MAGGRWRADLGNQLAWLAALVVATVISTAVVITWPLMTLALIGAAGVAALTLARPVVALGCLFAFLPFNGVVSQLLPDGTVALAVGASKDYVLLLLLLAAVLRGRGRSAPVRIVLPVLALLAVAGLAAFGSESAEQALYGWRNNYFPLLLLVCVPLLVDRAAVTRLTTLVAGVAQVSSAVALATWSLGLSWLFALGILPPVEGFPFQYFAEGSNQPRAFSPFGSPNEMAVATVVMLAAIWCRTDWGRRRVWLSVLPVGAVLASQSRSGLLGLVLLAAASAAHSSYGRGGWSRGMATVLFAAVAAAFAGVVALTAGSVKFDSSLRGHAVSVQESLPMLWQSPFGAGLGSVGPRAARYTETPVLVESFWLLLALEAGVLALMLFLAVLWGCARVGWSGDHLAAMAPLAIAGSLVSQLVLPTLQDTAFSYLLWSVVGLGVACALRGQVETEVMVQLAPRSNLTSVTTRPEATVNGDVRPARSMLPPDAKTIDPPWARK